MGRKRILVVSQCFYPEQFRINDICREWVKRGYQVTALTGIPNYPQGKFYEGYGLRKKRRERWNGIEIHRIPLFPRGSGSLTLILNYLSFVISGFFWSRLTKLDADVVFNFETSPMTQSLVAVWYAKRRGLPCYLYVQDLWPENVEIVTGIHTPLILGPINRMVKYIYKNCDKIFCTSESFVEEVRKKCADTKKIHFWPQYAEEFYRPAQRKPRAEFPEDGGFCVMFTGNIGAAQGLDTLVEAACLLKGEGCRIRFCLIGDGRQKQDLLRKIQKSGVSDLICFLGKRPAEEIPELLAHCDMAYVSFLDDALFEKTIPAKLQSYMACGKAILAAASGETETVIKDAGCGLCVPAGDVEGLKECLLRACRMEKEELLQMGRNARAYAGTHFDKKTLMDEMDRYLA